MPWMMSKGVNIRKTYEALLEPKLSGNEIDDGPEEVYTSFKVRRKRD